MAYSSSPLKWAKKQFREVQANSFLLNYYILLFTIKIKNLCQLLMTSC